MKEPEHYIRNE
jgi:hypothetical protein